MQNPRADAIQPKAQHTLRRNIWILRWRLICARKAHQRLLLRTMLRRLKEAEQRS